MPKYIVIALAVFAVGGGSFFGGMKYAESKTPRRVSQEDFQNLRDLSPEERQQRLQNMGANAGGPFNRRGGQAGANFAVGEIINKDNASATVKLRDGGSKIVFFSGQTTITKMATGSAQDLVVGEQITATGTQNQDGSVTAQNIQIRPVLPTGNGGTQ